MKKNRIVWVDDQINTLLLEPYVDEFIDNGFEVIRVDRVFDGLISVLKAQVQTSLSAILIDIIMPPGDLDFGETRGGMRTGIVVLQELMKEDSLKSIPIVVVTNADDETVRSICLEYGIPYLQKSEFFADTFVTRIMEIIHK